LAPTIKLKNLFHLFHLN